MATTQRHNRMVQLSQSEMLAEWKTRNGYSAGLRDCTVERDDGVDTDGILTRQICAWYAKLLAEGPVEWLPVYDVAAESAMAVDDNLVATVTLPDRCVRPLSLRLPGWKAAVTTFHQPGSRQAQRQQSEWTRGRTERPVCVAAGRELTAYSASSASDSAPASLLAVCYPADGSYVFAEAAWGFGAGQITPMV